MALATSCGYPANYFEDLSVDNDEELENERNDVRDVLRSVTDFGSVDVNGAFESSVSIRILEKFDSAFSEAI